MPLSGIALVTGGAGFIGSHIAEALAANGARVRIIDDLSTGYRENLEEIKGEIDFIQASLVDDLAVNRALEDVELVFPRLGFSDDGIALGFFSRVNSPEDVGG